jgi:GGDEF domain-containing protein
MGGDEFLALLPDCATSHVEVLLSRLRPMELDCGGTTISIYFSAGWVGYKQGETTEEFLERADRTLYAEKRNGKHAEGASANADGKGKAKAKLSAAVLSGQPGPDHAKLLT